MKFFIRIRNEFGGANVKKPKWFSGGYSHHGGCRGDMRCRTILHGMNSLPGKVLWTDIYTSLID